MANRYIGVNRGDSLGDASAAYFSSAQGKDVELTINLTNIPDRQDVINAFDKLRVAIITAPWPPA